MEAWLTMFIWVWGILHFQAVKCLFSCLTLLDYSKMDMPNPPTSKCITYWKRKVKSEYMRLRQLKRLQANMGAKVINNPRLICFDILIQCGGLGFLKLSFEILTIFPLAFLGSLCSKFCKGSRKNPDPQWRMEEASCPTCAVDEAREWAPFSQKGTFRCLSSAFLASLDQSCLFVFCIRDLLESK